MTASIIIAIIGVLITTISSIMVFTFYISGRLTKIEGTQKSNREAISDNIKSTKDTIMGAMKLMLSQELINIEKRFDEAEKMSMNIKTVLAKELQTERHRLNNLEHTLGLLKELKERRKDN